MKNFGEAYRGLMENITVPVMTPKDVLDAGSRIRKKRNIIYKRFSYAFAAVFLVFCCFAGATGYLIISERAAGQNSGSDAVTLDMVPDQGGSARVAAAYEEEYAVMKCNDEQTAIEYGSREEFLANSGFSVALPPKEKMGGHLTEEEYQLLGESSLFVRISSGDRQFELNQTYADVVREDSTQNLNEVIKEEQALGQEDVYTTAQGFTYTIESSEGDAADMVSILATISIEGYELSVGFIGFTKEEAFAILETMDLTVYQENSSR